MKQDEKNKAYFQETFGEVHAPESLCRKVTNMTKTEAKKMGMSVVKKLAVAAAIAAVLFAGSNGVAYAMTGSTWLETVVVKLNVNGAWYDMEMDGEMLEDGTVQYSATVEVPDGATTMIVTDAMENWEQDYYGVVSQDGEIIVDQPNVAEENGRVYITDSNVKIDITEDVQDGQAAGTYEKDGLTYNYEVTGSTGCWEFSIFVSEEME